MRPKMPKWLMESTLRGHKHVKEVSEDTEGATAGSLVSPDASALLMLEGEFVGEPADGFPQAIRPHFP